MSDTLASVRVGHPRIIRMLARMLALTLVVASTVASAPGVSRAAVTGLTDCRFSKAQVFDVQWFISGTTLNVSGMTSPYASHEPDYFTQPPIADGDTFAFYENGGEVGFRQFSADGTVKYTLHLSGAFRAIGPDFIFYTGGGFFGTLITSGQGFEYGDSTQLEVTAQNVTVEEALGYTSCASVPLAIGQTRAEAIVNDGAGDGTDVEPPATPQPGPTALEQTVAVVIEQSAGLSGTNALLVRGGEVLPMTTIPSASAGPLGGLVIEDGDGTLRVTVAGDRGVDPGSGIVVAQEGEIVCEICALLAAGSVVEAWIYSTPRLAAAVRVQADTDDGVCPLLRIPVGAPLDGGGGIASGAHTLQLRMETANGIEVLAVPISVGGPAAATTAGTPVPSRVNTGGGPMPLVPLPLGITLALAAILLTLLAQQRELAWVNATNTRRRTRPTPGRHLPAFDALQARLEDARRTSRTLRPPTPAGSRSGVGAETSTRTPDRFDALQARLDELRTSLDTTRSGS
jgi:hypothetical protein